MAPRSASVHALRDVASQSDITTEIDAIVSAATTQGLTAQQMADLCRRAVATAIALGGTTVGQITIGGQQYQIDLGVAERLERQYRAWAKEDDTTALGGMGFGKLQAGMS